MAVSFVSPTPGGPACAWCIVPVADTAGLDPGAMRSIGWLDGRLSRWRTDGDLTGAAGELLEIRDLPEGGPRRLLLTGLGPLASLTQQRFEQALVAAVRRLSSKKLDQVAVLLPDPAVAKLSGDAMARTAAVALTVGCVGQGLYKSQPDRFEFGAAAIVAAGEAAAAVDEGRILGESINLARELINRQPDDIFPEAFAARASELAEQYGFQCQVFDESLLQQERMHALLAVARGSVRPPRMVVVEHRGGRTDGPLLGLVGKGVTFDSGGLSLKPSDGMKTMKCDMAGAATALAAIVAAVRMKLPVNLIGLMGLVENMPSGSSYKLGDVLTARNGVTIEVQNTDAEGRLVLADVLSYAVDRGASHLIDLATLTGSCVVALGEEVAGGFTNNQPWCESVLAAAGRAGEDIWQMPMFEAFADQLKCDVADIKNVGTRWGGSITAAKFLEKFVGTTPWVHLDIAGPAFAESNKPHREGGATGAYVRTLVEAARAYS